MFYESSHRIDEALADCVAAFGADRAAVLARELTKLFETVLDGTLAELHARVVADANQRKGEFVLLVQGAGDDADAQLAEGRRLYAKLRRTPAAVDRGEAGGGDQRRAAQGAVRRRMNWQGMRRDDAAMPCPCIGASG